MPHYKALVAFRARNADFTDTIPITIGANNAIEAKALIQDQYGEKAVQFIMRDNSQNFRATRLQAIKHGD